MAKRDYYEVLGVDRGADAAALKSAYRKLALQDHPDRNPNDPGAAERFKEASEAYAVLSDPEKRNRYDRFGHAGMSGSAAGGFGGFDPSAFVDFTDLFGEFFGFGPGNRSGPAAGSDLVYRLAISFRESALGMEAPLEISRLEPCEACSSSGAQPGTRPVSCPACGGRGRQRYSQGFLTVTRPCTRCGGDGRIIEKPCAQCGGEGRKRVRRSLTIRIPAGIEEGNRLRLQGEGDVGPNGGPAGDLYVVVSVRSDELFERAGDDVVLNLELPFPTMVLGGEVRVPTLEGEQETISVASGTASGGEIRLRGKGFGRLGRRGRGDLVVILSVRVPKSPSAREKDLLRQYAQETGAPVEKPGVVEKAKRIWKKEADRG